MATMRGAKRGGGTKSRKAQTTVLKAPPSTRKTLDKTAKPKRHSNRNPSKKIVVEKASGKRKASKAASNVKAIEKSAMEEIEREKGAVVTLRNARVVVTLRRRRLPGNDDYDICEAPPGKDDTPGYD